jgi:hypothetical protein
MAVNTNSQKRCHGAIIGDLFVLELRPENGAGKMASPGKKIIIAVVALHLVQ